MTKIQILFSVLLIKIFSQIQNFIQMKFFIQFSYIGNKYAINCYLKENIPRAYEQLNIC